MKNLFELIRKQEVINLTIAFVLGATILKVVSSFVQDLVSPFLGVALQLSGNLSREIFRIGPTRFEWGNFVSIIIEALVVLLVVYIIYKFANRNRNAA